MKPVVTTPHEQSQDNPPPLEGRLLLAEGDSWFTVGSLNAFQNSNLLFELRVQSTTTILHCAYPGHTLQRMVDGINDRDFDRLLRRHGFARRWDAILLSAGGNDLIDAAQQPVLDRRGRPTPLADRLLLTPDEAATVKPGATGGARYVSEAGWSKLAGFLGANFRALVSRRDQGPAAGRPLLVHTYSMPTVWPVGTIGSPRGWLARALEDAGIAAQDRQGVADVLFGRLRQLLLSLDEGSGGADALPAVHVFDSAGTVALQPPDPSKKRGPSGDWINEIHPNRTGYRKLGKAMGAWLDGVLAANP